MNVQDAIDSFKNSDSVTPLSAEQGLKAVELLRSTLNMQVWMEKMKAEGFTDFQIGVFLGMNWKQFGSDVFTISEFLRSRG